jgi:hypothetical protein
LKAFNKNALQLQEKITHFSGFVRAVGPLIAGAAVR